MGCLGACQGLGADALTPVKKPIMPCGHNDVVDVIAGTGSVSYVKASKEIDGLPGTASKQSPEDTAAPVKNSTEPLGAVTQDPPAS